MIDMYPAPLDFHCKNVSLHILHRDTGYSSNYVTPELQATQAIEHGAWSEWNGNWKPSHVSRAGKTKASSQKNTSILFGGVIGHQGSLNATKF